MSADVSHDHGSRDVASRQRRNLGEMRINLFDFVSATGCFGICVSTSKPLSASVSSLHLPPDGSKQ